MMVLQGETTMSEVKYISQDSKSNKIWSYEILTPTSIKIRWGRIGLDQQEQIQEFPNSEKMQSFISKKVREKTADVPGKRYKQVQEETVKTEEEIAELLGAKNKIKSVNFVQRKDRNLIFMQEYDPEHYILVSIMHSWNKTTREFLLNKKESYELRKCTETNEGYKFEFIEISSSNIILGIRQHLKNITKAIREIINTFGFGGPRKLSLGEESQQVQEQIQEQIQEQFQHEETQVINILTKIGARAISLDI